MSVKWLFVFVSVPTDFFIFSNLFAKAPILIFSLPHRTGRDPTFETDGTTSLRRAQTRLQQKYIFGTYEMPQATPHKKLGIPDHCYTLSLCGVLSIVDLDSQII